MAVMIKYHINWEMGFASSPPCNSWLEGASYVLDPARQEVVRSNGVRPTGVFLGAESWDHYLNAPFYDEPLTPGNPVAATLSGGVLL